jgi:hypothetical protein
MRCNYRPPRVPHMKVFLGIAATLVATLAVITGPTPAHDVNAAECKPVRPSCGSPALP